MRYEEDSLHLSLNPRRGLLMYLRDPRDSGLQVVDAQAADPNCEEFFECDCGIEIETTMARTLPRTQAVEVLRDYLRTGALPQTVRWVG